MKDEIIGFVEISFKEDGSLEQASFNVNMGFKELPTMEEFDGLKSTHISDPIKDKADSILAGFFTKMNEFELADREKFEIASEVTTCNHYQDGRVKFCRIRYFLQERNISETTAL